MNSRERFLAAIKGEPVDRAPIVANLTIQLAEKLAKKLDKDVGFIDSFLATRISHRDILLELGNDVVLVAATRGKNGETKEIEPGIFLDEWKMKSKMVGLYSETFERPLADCETIQDLEKYEMPCAGDKERWGFAEEIVPKYKADYGIIGDLEACIFETAWNLVGLEKFIMDLLTEEEYIDPLLDKITDYSIECGLKLIDLGCDLIWTGDDMGTQENMLISPDLWRQYFKPRMKKMFETFKKANPNIKIAYHSCGSIYPIIDDLVEIGLDILNPLQPLAKGMEIGNIYQQYKDKLCFFGGIDVQDVLPNGSEEDVRAEVRRVIDATEGGKKYILAPAHNIQPDTSVENVIAMFDEAKKYKG